MYKAPYYTGIYILEASKFVRKYPSLFPLAKQQRPQQRSLRNRYLNELAVPTSRLAMFRSGPLAMCVKIYNKLPNSVKDTEYDNKFKNDLQNYLNLKSYYSLKEFLTEK